MDRFANLDKYQKIAFVSQNVQVVLGMIGIIGNMLAFAVFLRKPFRKNSYAFYFRLLSWTESFVLLHTFRHWARVVLGMDLNLVGALFCRLNEFHPFVSAATSNWLRMLILTDRCIQIIYPNQFKFIKTRLFQIGAVLLIITYNVSLHIKLPLNYRLESINSTLICFIPHEILAYNLFMIFVNLVISTIISTVITVRLISFIYSSRRRLRNRLSKPHSSVLKDRKFAISSIGINIFSLIGQIFFISSTLFAYSSPQISSSQIDMVFTLAITIAIFYNAFVFYVSLFMNSMFSKEFFGLFK